MLEAFLETVCEHEKRASAEGRMRELLDKLPTEDLQKVASGMTLKQAFFHESGDWLEKYKDSPLLQDAIALERECLEQQMESNARRRETDEFWREDSQYRDELMIRRKLLDLQLAEAEGAGEEAGDAAEDVVEDTGGSPEEAERAEEEAEEGAEEAAAEEEMDLDKVAMAMRFDIAVSKLAASKEAVSAKWVRDRVLAASSKASPSRLARADSKIQDVQRRAVNKIIDRTGKDAAGVASARSVSDKALVARDALKGKSLKLTKAPQSAPTKLPPSMSETMKIRTGATSKALPSAKKPSSTALRDTTRNEPSGVRSRVPETMKSNPGAPSAAGAPKSSGSKKALTGAGLVAGGAGVGAIGAGMASKDKAASVILTPEREEQIKAAFSGALMAGLKGMKSFAGTAGKSIAGAAQTGGARAAGQAAMNAGRAGAVRAGNFISKNPAAGAALVAAPAAAAGYAAG